MNAHLPQRLARLRVAGLDPESVPLPGPGQESVGDYLRPPALADELTGRFQGAQGTLHW